MKQPLLFPEMYDNMINDGINWIAPSKEIEGVPDIEMTMSKVLDGYPLLYHLATNEASETAIDCAALGSKRDFVSGWIMVSADNFSEDVTMVGSNKRWKATGGGK